MTPLGNGAKAAWRFATVLTMAIAVSALLVPRFAHSTGVRLVYNASSSAPRGWYRIDPSRDFGVGDYVVTRLPNDVAVFAAARGYLPLSVPALKRIAAQSPQQVCVQRSIVSIDETVLAQALTTDGAGRAMPRSTHCRALVAGELFLLNTSNAASFDSRYFGPIDVSFVIGKAIPLWTKP